LWRRLSRELLDADGEDDGVEALDAAEKCVGKFETGDRTEYRCSCATPYMMRAKLRFDIVSSERDKRGRFLILHPCRRGGKGTTTRAANRITGREART